MSENSERVWEFLITYGWAILVVLIFLGVLFYLGVFDPQEVIEEEFNPDEHVCLEWDVEVYLEEDNCGGQGKRWINESKGIYGIIRWSSCVDDEGNCVENCGGGLGYNENQAMCLEWRPKTINDLSCEELSKSLECNAEQDKNIRTTTYRECFGSLLGLDQEYLILNEKLEMGCFK